MDRPYFKTMNQKRQWIRLCAIVGVIALALLFSLLLSLTARGHEPHVDITGDNGPNSGKPHYHWFPRDEDSYNDGMEYCATQQGMCPKGDAQTDELIRYDPRGKPYRLVYCRICGSHLGTGQWRYAGHIVSPTPTPTSTSTPTLTPTSAAVETSTATPTATKPPALPLTSTPTPTATRGSGDGSPPGQPPSPGGIPRGTLTPTPTPTPTLLIIRPESTPAPTGTPLQPVPPLKGVDTPTPAPTPTQRPWRSPCLLQHAGAPLNLCESGDGWRVYYFGYRGNIQTGPYIPAYGGPVDRLFFAEVSPTTGKPVLAQWIADHRAIRIITYYAWHPYAEHKLYIVDIMPGGVVEFRQW